MQQTKYEFFRIFIVPLNKGTKVILCDLHDYDKTVAVAQFSPDGDDDEFMATNILDPNTQGVTDSAFALDDKDETGLEKYRAFKGLDIRGSLMDKAYVWITNNICPKYDRPDIHIENDILTVIADGIRADGGTSQRTNIAGNADSSGSGRVKPKIRKTNFGEIWF